MASDPDVDRWRDLRTIAAFVWIFGCAVYYYARFTWVFVGEHETALRELLSRLADMFALSRRAG